VCVAAGRRHEVSWQELVTTNAVAQTQKRSRRFGSAMTKTARDRRVLGVSKDNWSWAVWLVTTQFKEGARSPEIAEDIAVEVSNRLRSDAEAARKRNGYFRTSMIRPFGLNLLSTRTFGTW
jgi:hypothetical protein